MPDAPLNPAFCPRCQKAIDRTDDFCRSCGANQKVAASVASPPPPAYDLAYDTASVASYPPAASPVQAAYPPASAYPAQTGQPWQPAYPAQQPNVLYAAPTRPSNAGWWAAALLVLFSFPLGCITVPVLLLTLFVAVLLIAKVGVAVLAVLLLSWPTVAALAGSLAVWKSKTVPEEKKMQTIAIVVGVGLIVNAFVLLAHHRR